MISIIVPIYGVEKYIRECVESILAQTLPDIEIILVDDGSKDGCPAICDEYAAKDGRVKVIHKENGGLVSARQAGLKAASGDYIGFVDGDDKIEPDMYLETDKLIKKYSPDAVVCEYFCDYEDRTEISSQMFGREYYNKEELRNEIYPKMLFAGKYYSFGISPNCWSKVFRREILEKYLPLVDPDTRMGEDAAFTYPCLLDSESVCFIKKPLYRYRILSSSMSRGYDEKLRDIVFHAYRRLKENNEKADFDISEQLDYYLVYLANFLIRNCAKAGGKISKKEIKDTLGGIVKDAEIVSAARRVRRGLLPIHTRIIVFLIKNKLGKGLYLYTAFLGTYLKGA